MDDTTTAYDAALGASQAKGPLGPDVGLTDLLDATSLERQAKEQEAGAQRFNPLRPSAAGYCARKLAYAYSAYRGHSEPVFEEKKPSVIRLLDLGHHIERAVLDQLYKAGIFQLKYKQQSLHFLKLSDGTIIEGSPDVMIEFPDGSRGLYDIKSKGEKYSSWRDSSWEEDLYKLSKMHTVQSISETSFWVDDLEAFLKELNDDNFMHNFVQCNAYALNPFMIERNVTFGGILRYNKNNSKIMEVRFRPSAALYDYFIDKLKLVHENEKTPELVPKEASLGSMSCAFCPYVSRCWPEVNAQKEYYKTLPDKFWATDTNRLGNEGARLDELSEEFGKAEKETAAFDVTKGEMLKLMEAVGKKKIRTADGMVYEAKFLKSPRPHYELRRSKV